MSQEFRTNSLPSPIPDYCVEDGNPILLPNLDMQREGPSLANPEHTLTEPKNAAAEGARELWNKQKQMGIVAENVGVAVVSGKDGTPRYFSFFEGAFEEKFQRFYLDPVPDDHGIRRIILSLIAHGYTLIAEHFWSTKNGWKTLADFELPVTQAPSTAEKIECLVRSWNLTNATKYQPMTEMGVHLQNTHFETRSSRFPSLLTEGIYDAIAGIREAQGSGHPFEAKKIASDALTLLETTLLSLRKEGRDPTVQEANVLFCYSVIANYVEKKNLRIPSQGKAPELYSLYMESSRLFKKLIKTTDARGMRFKSVGLQGIQTFRTKVEKNGWEWLRPKVSFFSFSTSPKTPN